MRDGHPRSEQRTPTRSRQSSAARRLPGAASGSAFAVAGIYEMGSKEGGIELGDPSPCPPPVKREGMSSILLPIAHRMGARSSSPVYGGG
jgi:hypothetical protein